MPRQTTFRLLLDHFWTAFGLVSDYFWTTFGLALDCFRTGFGLVWKPFWSGFGSHFRLVLDWVWTGCGLVSEFWVRCTVTVYSVTAGCYRFFGLTHTRWYSWWVPKSIHTVAADNARVLSGKVNCRLVVQSVSKRPTKAYFQISIL